LRRNNNRGYVDSLDEDLNTSTQKLLFFANRNVITYSSLSGKYSISSKMNFNVAVRNGRMQRIRTFISKANGRLANLNYNINKDSSFTLEF
jgi:hypothetical protein